MRNKWFAADIHIATYVKTQVVRIVVLFTRLW